MACLRIKALLQHDADLCGRAYSHSELARWLLTARKLSKNKIGDFLGRADDDAVAILRAFLAELDLAPFAFDEALRFFLSLFRLPGEAQQIDRIMENFAERYHEARHGVFSSADTAYAHVHVACACAYADTAYDDAAPRRPPCTGRTSAGAPGPQSAARRKGN